VIDVLFPVYHRDHFTAAALATLRANTPHGMANIIVHEDWRNEGPVAVMNRHLANPGSEIFAKIDNDTIVPPGWLESALAVMEAHPELGLLGIEPPASRTPAPWAGGQRIPAPEMTMQASPGQPTYAPCEMIGGIGLMSRAAFAACASDPMRPHAQNGVGGFSDWQRRHPEVVKGWIVPPLKVFLLDRLPIEPWVSMSRQYIARGWQRPWTNYAPADSALWDWWLDHLRKTA
jgi:hypothetical protein